MTSIMKIAVDYYLIDGMIGIFGVLAFTLMLERAKALYLDASMNSKEFMSKLLKLVDSDRIEDAIAYCDEHKKKPVAHVCRRVLERSDRDEETIEATLDIAASEVLPQLTKNLPLISMTANVATLIGLLGTVVGLIMSFKAVSFADPSQKQTLLADGIAMAMHATALGLIVAIPCIVAYSFLYTRQTRITSEIDFCSSQLVQALKDRELPQSAGVAIAAPQPPPVSAKVIRMNRVA